MALKVVHEINIEKEPCVLAWDNNLFVGTEDGLIKSYDAKLSSIASWTAHAVQIFALDAANGKVYSTSNDGGVKVWSAQGEKICEYPHTGGDIETLHVYDSNVFTGDEIGYIAVYENNVLKANYHVLEEVKDLQYKPPFLFTARDLYVTVTEINPAESKSRFVTRHTMEGRAPMRVAGDKIIIIGRDGNHLRLHYATAENEFQQLHEIKGSDMIITSIAVSGNFVWTGGWDGHVRRWEISKNQLVPAGEINLGGCINTLVTNSESVYAAVVGKKLVQIKC